MHFSTQLLAGRPECRTCRRAPQTHIRLCSPTAPGPRRGGKLPTLMTEPIWRLPHRDAPGCRLHWATRALEAAACGVPSQQTQQRRSLMGCCCGCWLQLPQGSGPVHVSQLVLFCRWRQAEETGLPQQQIYTHPSIPTIKAAPPPDPKHRKEYPSAHVGNHCCGV